MSINLEILKSKIESMDKNHHIEILRILKNKSQIKLNENKSGVFINLSYLPNETIEEIKKYLNYVQDQETLLNPIETQKENFKHSFFDNSKEKCIKDKAPLYYTK